MEWSSHLEANKYCIINRNSPLMGNSETEPEKWHSQTCSQWTLSPLHEYLQEIHQPHQAMRQSPQEKASMLIDNRHHKIWLGSRRPYYMYFTYTKHYILFLDINNISSLIEWTIYKIPIRDVDDHLGYSKSNQTWVLNTTLRQTFQLNSQIMHQQELVVS